MSQLKVLAARRPTTDHTTIETLQSLFRKAETVGIDCAAAWRIVFAHRMPNDPSPGVQALIDEIGRRCPN